VFYHDTGRFPPNSTTFIDPLVDPVICARDIPHMLKLGINTVLVSGINSAFDHKTCMQQFLDANIYVIVTLNGRNELRFFADGDYIDPFDYTLFDRFNKLADQFNKYPNMLGFMLQLDDDAVANLGALPGRKTIIRALKQYIRSKNYRDIPVGVASLLHRTTAVSNYASCGEDSHADFQILNLAVKRADIPMNRCNLNASIEHDSIVDNYRNSSVPVLFSIGCQTTVDHRFDEIQAIYGDAMTSVFSGAVILEWFNNNEGDDMDDGTPMLLKRRGG
jgi:Glucanosyltransferase